MDTLSAWVMGAANRNKQQMVFDWNKAARLIKERNPEYAAAGLRGDWEYTGGKIYDDGKPVPSEETDTYLASTWAVPEIEIDGQVLPCYVMEDEAPGWNSDTYWPESSLAILSE